MVRKILRRLCLYSLRLYRLIIYKNDKAENICLPETICPVPCPCSEVVQRMLMQRYRQDDVSSDSNLSFQDVGFSVYSETDEDGILLYILSLIGVARMSAIDIGAGGVHGSNTANLIMHHGWRVLLIDGDSEKIRNTQNHYARRGVDEGRAMCVSQHITADNIDAIISEYGFDQEVDVLSIDVDGIDYWIWKAIEVVSPRVVIIEYQCIWGPEASVTVPNDPDFQPEYAGQFGVYCGASLPALVKLAREKGYRLVGSNRFGFNAFFVRNDLGKDVLPEVAPEHCFQHPFTHWAQKQFFDRCREKEWINV